MGLAKATQSSRFEPL